MDYLIDQYHLFRIRTKRDPEAFGRIYDRYVAQIYRFVFLKLPSKEAAQDVTSEAFLRLWQYLLKQNEVANVRALLYRMARNLVADHYRQAEHRLTVPLEQVVTSEDAEPSSDNESQIEARADLALILERISRLKEDFRDVLLLRLVDDLPFQDIAVILDKKPGAVRVIFHRAMKALDAISKDSV